MEFEQLLKEPKNSYIPWIDSPSSGSPRQSKIIFRQSKDKQESIGAK